MSQLRSENERLKEHVLDLEREIRDSGSKQEDESEETVQLRRQVSDLKKIVEVSGLFSFFLCVCVCACVEM